MQTIYTDFLIIGSGIIGLSIAKELKERFPDVKISIIEKELDVAKHSSGRNSGVLHAGFYYTSDSLKAKFTKEGNEYWRNYCYEHKLKINECKKVVVATNEEELKGIYELDNRAKKNQVPVKIIDEKELKEIEQKAKTFEKALFSPLTATIDPIEISNHLKINLINKNVEFFFQEPYISRQSNFVLTKNFKINAKTIINCAGLYADKIAKDFGLSKDYEILPFKGLYLKYIKQDTPIRVNIYPVPNLKQPFLGVHFTVTVDGNLKIGPTAIPCFWREQYNGFRNFKISEFISIIKKETELLFKNSFSFRNLALQEIKKYSRKTFIEMAAKLVQDIDFSGFREWSKPGIRAQLVYTKTNELVQDFVIEKEEHSIHVLNAVSPAFTASIPFAKYIIDNYIKI